MITIGLDPNLPTLGPLTPTWHGLFTLLAVVAGIAVALILARRAELPEEQVYATALWGIPGGIIGARLVHVIDQWPYYAANPAAILGLSGTSLYGALLGGALAGALYARVKGFPVGRMADVAAPAMLVAQIIGRIGCLINGDAYGSPTSLPWGIVYTHPNAAAPLGVAGHPAPAYEILWDLIVLGVLWRLRGKAGKPGALFFLYLVLYSAGRFFITFWRENTVVAMGLQQAHIIALLIMAVGLPALLYLRRT